MSHTTTVKTVAITDVAALRKTAEELAASGVVCSLVENAKPRMYYDRQEVMCDFVLRLDNARCRHTSKTYDVGFQKQKDGSLAPIFDEYGGGVASQLGVRMSEPKLSAEDRSKRTIGKLIAGYAKHAAINAAKKKGYTVSSVKVDAEGNAQIKIAV